MSRSISVAELRRCLTQARGMLGPLVLIHSSLKRIGYLEEGPGMLVGELLRVLGPDGTLVAPYFTDIDASVRDRWRQEVRANTGRLAEVLAAHPDAQISDHPTHAVVAVGRAASAITAGHAEHGAFGLASPLDRFAERDGRILLCGVGHVANSMIHIGETHAGRPKGQLVDVDAARQPASSVQVTPDASASCSAAFGSIEHPLRVRGEIRDWRIGEALCQVVAARSVIETTTNLIRGNPTELLCSFPGCTRCGFTRHALAGFDRPRSGDGA